ncbi:MAG: DUF1353 domain-containing protein [bacterium]|nr:DUF1353 domain-containing protein [bacterium]
MTKTILVRVVAVIGALISVAVCVHGATLVHDAVALEWSTGEADAGESVVLQLEAAKRPAWTGAGLLVVGLLGLALALGNVPLSGPSELDGPPLAAERLPNGRRKLSRDLELCVSGEKLTIPEGTKTDFSSIPPFARALVRWSRVDVAGVVHDFLYQTGGRSRWSADLIWFKVAISGDHRANLLQAGIAWLGLVLGAWWVWYGYRWGWRKVP